MHSKQRIVIGDNQSVARGYHTIKRQYKWTPKEPFWFGGKQFEANKECKFFETNNFGWIVQGKLVGQE